MTLCVPSVAAPKAAHKEATSCIPQSLKLHTKKLQTAYAESINGALPRPAEHTEMRNGRAFTAHAPFRSASASTTPKAHFSGFQPCAFSSNSPPSRVTSTRPRLSLVMWPMRWTSSMALIFSWSPIGTVNSSS